MVIVAVHNLTKFYDGFTAVDHINFEVNEGEIFGFLGPNGAGKTTTWRMLTGIITPDDGEVTILGYDIHDEPLKVKQYMGVVPETSNAYVDLTAWQNIILMSELYGIPKKDAQIRAKNLLNQLRLYERKDQKVKGFSKGMKQRLILAMALINDPTILFLDEPTSGLDVQSRRLIKDILQELSNEGKTIFLTTHDMEEANQLCERVAIINRGRIATIDRPEILKNRIKKLNSVEISFDRTINIHELSEISGAAEVKVEGDKFRIYTKNINDLILSLTHFAEERELRIITMNTLLPSLEEVFIELTGGS